jgi:hypothetical protein
VEQQTASHGTVGADRGNGTRALDLPVEGDRGRADLLGVSTEGDEIAEGGTGGGVTGAAKELAAAELR